MKIRKTGDVRFERFAEDRLITVFGLIMFFVGALLVHSGSIGIAGAAVVAGLCITIELCRVWLFERTKEVDR